MMLIMSAQITYAACDALAAVLIFVAMVRTKVLTSTSDDYYSNIAAKAKSVCQGVVDLNYTGKTCDSQRSSDLVSRFIRLLCLYFLADYFQFYGNESKSSRSCR